MRKGIRILLYVLAFVVILSGLGIMFYPVISDKWNAYRNSRLIVNYQSSVVDLDAEHREEVFQGAKEYNDQHTENCVIDAFGDEKYILTHPYDTLLDPSGNGIMGYLEVPKIHVEIPIYHGVGAEILEHGCGHVEGTSLPIGGIGTHSVLAAHRGLANAKLFTDLDQLAEGDVFFLYVLNETLCYEVDQIKVVLPDQLADLALDPEQDYVTLLTCTPYAVNTHRLLVRGHRIPYTEEAEQILHKEEQRVNTIKVLVYAGIAVVILAIVLLIIRRRSRRKQANEIQS